MNLCGHNHVKEPKSLKKLYETRWSCRTDALKSVYLNFSEIIEKLDHIHDMIMTQVHKLKLKV